MKKYKGKLAEYLPKAPETTGLLKVEKDPDAAKEWRGEVDERLRLLCDYHNVEWREDERPNWFELAMALAVTHVKGFQFSKAGRKATNHTQKASFARKELLAIADEISSGHTGQAASDNATAIHLTSHIGKNKLPEFFQGKAANTVRSAISKARAERNAEKEFLKRAFQGVGDPFLSGFPSNQEGKK